jgi:CRISPR/Cas system-associated exonuclease Cas4 (RecB family)
MAKNLIQQVMVKPKESAINVDGLIEKIQSGYLVDRGPKHQKKKSFSPSSIAYGHGECPRYWYLAFDGAEFADDADAYAVANMSNGTLSHDRIQTAMEKSGILKEKEVKVIYDDPPIFGFADGVIDWNSYDYPIEIKTMREESFQYRKTSNEPPDYHLIQLLIYMKIMNKDKGLFVYESKNSHELHIIPVELKPEYAEWLDKAFQWMRDVRSAWTDQTLPIKPYRSNSKICKNCPVKSTCDNAGKGVLKISPLEKLA